MALRLIQEVESSKFIQFAQSFLQVDATTRKQLRDFVNRIRSQASNSSSFLWADEDGIDGSFSRLGLRSSQDHNS